MLELIYFSLGLITGYGLRHIISWVIVHGEKR